MSDRTDLVAGIYTMLEAFKAANPTLLRRNFTVRPPSLVTDLPCAYIDGVRPAKVHYDSAMRDQTFTASVVFVDQLTDNTETESRMDVLVDAMVEHLDNYPLLIAGNGVWSDSTWGDEAENLGHPDGQDAPAAAVRLTFTDILIKHSRL